jgi:uncharacterized protein (TIGR02118 family)
MAGVKLVVMYPRPKDVDAFEHVYQKEHVPMAVEKLKGKTKFVATKVTGSPQGTAPFYRIAEVHFHGSAANLRRFRGRPADGGTCREDLLGRTAGGDDRRRRVVQLLTGGACSALLDSRFNFLRPRWRGASRHL